MESNRLRCMLMTPRQGRIRPRCPSSDGRPTMAGAQVTRSHVVDLVWNAGMLERVGRFVPSEGWRNRPVSGLPGIRENGKGRFWIGGWRTWHGNMHETSQRVSPEHRDRGLRWPFHAFRLIADNRAQPSALLHQPLGDLGPLVFVITCPAPVDGY